MTDKNDGGPAFRLGRVLFVPASIIIMWVVIGYVLMDWNIVWWGDQLRYFHIVLSAAVCVLMAAAPCKYPWERRKNGPKS